MTRRTPPFELDPFALPQETRGRFWMFIAAAVIFAWSLGGWWVEVPNPFALVAQAPPDIGKLLDDLLAARSLDRVTQEQILQFMDSPFFQKVREYMQLHLFRIFIATGLAVAILAVAVLSYFLRLSYDRRHAEPLNGEVPEREISSLAAVAEISPPRLTWRFGVLDGLAFGRKGKEVLVLGGHPRIFARPWPAVTRAVALHEMAHIAHGDIRTRELSRSLWQALAFVLVLSTLGVGTVSALLHGELRVPLVRPDLLPSSTESPPLWLHGVKTAGVLCLMAWLWASLVRAREFYADARVAAWGYRDALVQRLRLPELRRSRWSLRRHPNHKQRLACLESQQGLFQVSPGLAFTTGLLVTLMGVHLAPLVFDGFFLLAPIHGVLMIVAGPVSILLFLPPALLLTAAVTHLLTRALGTQVQRQAVADLATGPHHEWRYLGLFLPAACFALGAETGVLLSPSDLFGLHSASPRLGLAAAATTSVLWLWLVLLRAASRFLLGTADGERHWQRWQRRLSLGSTVLLVPLVWPLLLLRLSLEGSRHFEWAFPLSAYGLDPVETFEIIFVIFGLLGLTAGLTTYLIFTLLLLAIAAWRFWRARPRCPNCKISVARGLIVGRLCIACTRPLTPWFLRPKLEASST